MGARVVARVALCAVLASCGGSSDPSVILDPGTGETNAAPLWPMRVGERFAVVEDTPGFQLYAPIELGSERVYRYGGPSSYPSGQPSAQVPPPALPLPWYYFSETDGDLYYRGNLREGVFAKPVLYLPKTIRQGMRWRVGRFTFEALSREEGAATIYGPQVQWTIQLTQSVTFVAADADNPDPLTQDVVTMLRFAEGIGPLTMDPLRPGTGDIVSAVIPPDGDVTPVARAHIAITPRAETQPVVMGLLSYLLTAIDNPANPSPLRTNMYGTSYGPIGNDPEGGTLCAFDSTLVCAGTGASDYCADPATTLVSSTGDELYRPQAATCEHCDQGANCTHCWKTIFETPTGIVWDRIVDNELDVFHGLTPNADDDLSAGFAAVPSINTDIVGVAADGLSFGRRIDEMTGAARLANGIWHIHMDPSRQFSVPYRATDATVNLSIRASAGSHDFIRSTPDGQIDRLIARQDGIVIQPLGQVDLPDGHLLTGAFETNGKLVIVTNSGFQGSDVQYTRFGDDLDFNSCTSAAMGDTYTWDADLPPAVDPIAPQPIEHVTFSQVGMDTRICWGPTSEPFDPTGWTVGGAPAAQVIPPQPGELCAVIQCQHVDGTCASGAVQGPVPGVGAVLVARPKVIVCNKDDDCRGDFCTTFTCIDGGCHATPHPDGEACDDGLGACSSHQHCTNGTCGGTNTCPVLNLPCVTTESGCTTPGICTPPVIAANMCLGDAACVAQGSVDPAKPCLSCGANHLFVGNGTGCYDTDGCHYDGDRDPLEPTNQCRAYVCNELQGSGGFYPVPLGTNCDNGDTCHGNDTCDGQGTCVAGPCP